jgi:hypothetical protein
VPPTTIEGQVRFWHVQMSASHYESACGFGLMYNREAAESKSRSTFARILARCHESRVIADQCDRAGTLKIIFVPSSYEQSMPVSEM